MDAQSLPLEGLTPLDFGGVLSSNFLAINRSSHRRCSVKKDVLKNLAKFLGKHLCWSLFFNKVARPVADPEILKRGDAIC